MTLTEALAALNRAGRIRLASVPEFDLYRLHYPDLRAAVANAATVGVLAYLAREATGEPLLVAQHSEYLPDGPGWAVVGRGWARSGATEGETWAAVLVAAAERCTAGGGA